RTGSLVMCGTRLVRTGAMVVSLCTTGRIERMAVWAVTGTLAWVRIARAAETVGALTSATAVWARTGSEVMCGTRLVRTGATVTSLVTTGRLERMAVCAVTGTLAWVRIARAAETVGALTSATAVWARIGSEVMCGARLVRTGATVTSLV